MRNNLPEYKLAGLWQDLITREDTLVTESGEPLRVIYPGWPNDGRGADFRDAVVASGGSIQRGEIELHTNSAD